MEDPAVLRCNKRVSSRKPTTTPVERSPTFSIYSHTASPCFSPAHLSPHCTNIHMEKAEHPLHYTDFSEQDSALHIRRDCPDHHTGMPTAGWDWRSRKWLNDSKHDGYPHHHQHRHHRQQESFPDESIDGRISRLRQDAGRMVHEGRLAHARRSSRQAGWVSELESISERKRRDGYGGEALTRIRRDKIGLRSRRRANHHGMDIHSRRKLMRREYQLRRDCIGARRNKGEGEIVSSLQSLGQSKHASKSFCMQTLEDYLIERSAARKRQNEDTQGGSEIASVQPTLNCSAGKYFEKPRRSTRRSAVVRPMKDISTEPESQLPLSIYAPEDGPDVDSEVQRSGCGLSWRWLNAHQPKDESSVPLDNTGAGCFPAVSKRRIGRRLLVSRQRKAGFVGWDKYNSEGSFTSFDSDSETVPLMTEPEPFNDYTTDDFAGSSVELERGLCRESKARKASRFKESGMSSNGQTSFRKSDYDGEIGMHARQSVEQHRSFSQKHRPKTFKDLVGQPMVAQSLSNAVLRGKIAPVYLFQGPRGTGKTCSARIFTAALNCLSAEELRPCGTCKECTSLHAGKNFDVREVDAAGNNGIEGMKLLLKHISLPPASRYKVFIIDECHLLTMDAWNAFLKSLEEPPSYVVFILVTTDPDRLPRTALSRCQKFLFSKIKDADIVSRLQKIALWERIDVELAALQLIASRSDGSLRDAEMTLDQISLLDKRATLSVVQDLVGMISEKKLIEFLELALSPDTSSTVKSIRDFMESGVEPLALISQLATLITDIIAGNNRSAAYRLKHVRKVEDERFRQALRILSDAERQLRTCTDKTIWMTAALLQFSQIDPSNVPPYSLGTSVTQSPVNFFDTSEKETLEGDVKWDIRSPQHAERMDRGDSKSQDNRSNPFSGPLTGNKVHPCSQSPKSAADIHDVKTLAGVSKPPVVPRALSSVVNRAEQKPASTLSSCSMDSIWKKVVDSSRSNVIKQLLRGEAKLLSLSVTEVLAVAHLEFKHPEHKRVAERARSSIANAFQEALGCPVEVKVTLSSSTAEDGKLGCQAGSPSLTGNLEPQSRQKKMVMLSKGDNKAHHLDERGSLQDQRSSRSGSFRKSSSSAKFGIPVASSPRLRLPEPRKPRHSLEVDESPYNQRFSTDISDRERSNVAKGKVKEGEDRMLKPGSHVTENDTLENRRVSVHYDRKANRSSNPYNLHKLDDANGGHGLDPYSRETMDKDSEAEHGFSPSPRINGNAFSIDVDKDGSDSEAQGRYGPSLLCWKGSRINDGKGKHQRLRRKRRGRLLLKFVPCAKGEGRS